MVILSIKVVRKDSDFELLNQHHETKMNKLAKMRKPGIASGQKSLGAIDQTPRPTLSPIWISMLIVNVDFFVGHIVQLHVGHHIHLHVGHHVWQYFFLSANLSSSISATTMLYRRFVRTLRLLEWKSESLTDGLMDNGHTRVGARDVCLRI